MRLFKINKKSLVTIALSLGLVTTIGFSSASNGSDSIKPAMLGGNSPLVFTDNPRADNSGTTGSEGVLVSSANTSNSDLATVIKPANKQLNSKSIPEDIPQSWLDQVQKDIAQREYHITWQDKTTLPNNQPAWQAPNRAHDFRTYFTDQGLTVVPRSGAKDWLWSLKLIAYGDVPINITTKPEVKTNRIEYRHSAKLKEWYINNEQGLEQGFTLNAPANSNEANKSQATKNNNTLKLSFQLGGSLTATLTNNKQTISLKDKNKQQRFTFGKLKVIDATNKTLKSHFELDQQTQILTLVTDASNAVYPIMVDPVLSGASTFLESNQANAYFGFSVASARDVNGDGYDDVIVGAPNYSNSQNNVGAVFIYYGTSSGINLNALSTSILGFQAGAQFGISVASAGNVNGDINVTTGLPINDVIIGAYTYKTNGVAVGAAFVYLGSSTIVSAIQGPWAAVGNQPDAGFGVSVASAGDVNGDGFGDVIIGASSYDNGEVDEGAAFMYLGSSAGLTTTPNPGTGPSPVADWAVEGNQFSALFGYSVASAGDVNGDGFGDVIIGARRYNNGENYEGAAFVYLGSSTGLISEINPGVGPSHVADWTAESNTTNAEFGYSVASAGDINNDGFGDIVIGAPYYDNGQTYKGATFVYLGTSSGLKTIANTGAGPSPLVDWFAESNQMSASIGWSVASAGDVNGDGFGDVIVGAPFFNRGGQRFEGAAFIYLGSSTGLNSVIGWSSESNQASAKFGYSVASAGDINGDGFSDVIIGADTFNNGEFSEGAVFVYLGSSTSLNPTSTWTAQGDQDFELFGYSVASAGDVNGDGYGDVIVGARLYDNGETDEGAVFVYLGSSVGINILGIWFAEGNKVSAEFGYSVASAGDINGDGFGDVIVGAPFYDNGQNGVGAAFLYLGSRVGLTTTINSDTGPSPVADWAAESNLGAGYIGTSVSSAGDVNGDGFSDVIIGGGDVVFVYLGSRLGLSTVINTGTGANPIAEWSAKSNQVSARFGTAVASAGDVNGDGYGDVIVGANSYDNGESNEGAAFVYLGSKLGLTKTVNPGAGPSPVADWSAESNQLAANYGRSVASAGDINGDGYGDVIVGAYGYDNGENNEGAAFVYLGAANGLSPGAAWTAESNQISAYFGWSVASAGDINGDGFGDVIVGAPYYYNGEINEGAAFVYLGSSKGLTKTLAPVTEPNPKADWVAESNQGGFSPFFGSTVASTGDINGDGFGDVIVGSPNYDEIKVDEGAVAIYDLTPPLARFTPSGSYNITQHLVGQRSDLSTLVPACGLSDRRDSFKLKAIRNNAVPDATLLLEWEVKANGQAFDGMTTNKSVSPTTYTGGVTTLTEIVSVLSPKTAYRWRARVLENGVAGPWLRVLNHDVQGCDIRTNTESDLALIITGPAAVADQHDFDVVFTINNNVAPANGPDLAQVVQLDISNIPSTYIYKTFSSNNASTSCGSPNVGPGFRTDTCTVTSINPGTATTITITYQATSQVNGSLVGNLSLKNYDPDLTNNTATYNVTVTPPVGVTLSPMTNFVTDENKLMVSRSVVLNGPPDGVVTISVASGNTSEGSATPSKVTFDAEDWNIPKPVSVHGMPEDMMNIDSGFTNYIVFLTPISTVQLDNTQINMTTVLNKGAIELSGKNNSTNTDLQADVLAIPSAQSPGYDAKNIPAGNVSILWNKVTSPREVAVSYTLTLCKDDVTLNTGCLDPIIVADNNFTPMFYASFGGSSLLFLGLLNTRIRRRWVLVLVTVAVASTLVSCGGGGGSDLPPSAPPAPDTMGTTVSLAAGTWYWQVVASDGGTPVASEVMIFTVQ